jgi:hypothetical protein
MTTLAIVLGVCALVMVLCLLIVVIGAVVFR